MQKANILITPSILSADFRCLQKEVGSVEPYADWLQVDVMDGHFVPNLSFGAPVLQWLEVRLPLDIHLMVSNPADRLKEFLDLNVNNITFHAEVVKNTSERKAFIELIHEGDATAGIALNPSTPLSVVEDILPDIDVLLIMSVAPGFGGQAFISSVLEKVQEARRKYPNLMIQIDGGVDAVTAPKCIAAGANNLVSGSFIFRSLDRASAIASLRGS